MSRRLQFERLGPGLALLIAGAFFVACSSGGGSGRNDGTGDQNGGNQPSEPKVRLVVPAEGMTAGGEAVTIVARNFSDDFRELAPRVYFGNRQVLVTPLDAGSLEVITPTNGVGTVDILVIGAASAESAYHPDGFTYRAPDISIEPFVALTCTPVVLRTTEFEDDFEANPPRVFVRGTEAVVLGATDEEVHFIVPMVAAGLADVTVEATGTEEQVTGPNCMEVLPGYGD